VRTSSTVEGAAAKAAAMEAAAVTQAAERAGMRDGLAVVRRESDAAAAVHIAARTIRVVVAIDNRPTVRDEAMVVELDAMVVPVRVPMMESPAEAAEEADTKP
jgi:hypothetical protein